MLTVDAKLLPCKLFYAFYYAGFWAFMPTSTHFLLQNGFSPLAFSIVTSSVPFTVLVYKPLVGSYVDRTRRHKLALMLCTIVSMICFSLFYSIPSMENGISNVHGFNKSTCNATESNCSKISTNTNISNTDVSILKCTNQSIMCEANTISKASESSSLQFIKKYQFWLSLITYNFGLGLGMMPAITLLDSLTMNVLCGDAKKFGKQRMWMAPLGLIVMPLAGYLSDLTSYKINDVIKVNYFPNLVLLLIFDTLCLLVIVFLPKPVEQETGKSVNEDTGIKAMLKMFKKRDVCSFAIVSFIYGMVYGQGCVLTVVFFISIGASQITIYLAVSSFVVMLFCSSFFSGRVVNLLGSQQTLLLALLIFGLRAIFCAYIKNPWLSLITEPIMAISYAIFTTNMVTFVKKHAKPGCEASAQSFMNVIDEGIGAGIGIMVSGWIHGKYGIFSAWCSFGIMAFTLSIGYFVIWKVFSMSLFKSNEMSYLKKKPQAEVDNTVL